MTTSLPSTPSIEQLKNQAKDLVRAFKAQDPNAVRRVQSHLPRAAALSSDALLSSGLTLSEAQLVLAREYEFPSWARLKRHVESQNLDSEAAMKAFVQAVRTSDHAKLRALLRSSPLIRPRIDDPVCHFDSPAIVEAAGRQDRKTVEVLLEFGADIKARSSWWAGGFGVLPNDDPEFARFLIERGAVVDVWAAAGLNRLDRLRELIQAEPELVNARGGDGMGTLHFAASVEIAQYLLDHGADLEMRDLDHNGTPAQTLVVERPEICRYLLSRGAELDIFMAVQLGDLDLVRKALADDADAIKARLGAGRFTSGESTGGHIYLYKLHNGQSPLYLAAELGRRDVYRYLMSQSPPAQQLLAACVAVDHATVDELLASHPDIVRGLAPDEMRAIADAAWSHKTESVRLMLKIGFDIEARGDHQSTALNRAAVRGFAVLIDLLLSQGASLEARNEFGGRPLGACIWGAENFRDPHGDYVASVEKLLAAGAPLSDIRYPCANKQVNAVLRRHLDTLSRTNIIAAILFGSQDRALALLKANPELVNETAGGSLPLMQAVRTNQPAMVRLLLEHGANPALQETPSGPTCREAAANLGSAEITKLLQSAEWL